MEDNFDKETVSGSESKKKDFNLAKEIFEWFYTIVIALIIAFLIKGFLFDIVEVEGPSMEPTLFGGDRLIVTKIGYKPKQGDIVILDSTYEKRGEYYQEEAAADGKSVDWWYKLTNYMKLPQNLKSKYYVKRVIALEGQTVDIKDGHVIVDGEVLDEPYYDGITNIMDPTVDYPITIEEDHVFVMGDNRPRSLDSRDSSLGQVPSKAFIGKSQFRIWPFNSFGPTK